LGYLQDPEGVLVPGKVAARMPADEVVFIVTGSQGEPMAVLSRIANRDHPQIVVGEGDTVIVSATPIPGNETSVFRIINQLFQSGAEVIYSGRALVHVSGHASREELVRMIELTRPTYLIPTHGEHRHLALYADLAVEQGFPREHITMAEIGDVVELDADGIGIREQLDVGYVYVEGKSVGQVDDIVLRDRQSLSRDGLVMIAVSIDRDTARILSGPKLVTRGFSRSQNGEDLVSGMLDAVRAAFLERAEDGLSDGGTAYSRVIREAAANYLYSRTRRRPMILPLVLES
jgi:ribonuclease J